MAPAKPFRVEALLPAPAHTYFLERDSAAFRSLLSKVLKIGQLEFNDLWHEGSSSFVRMVTKPEFGSWVPKSVAGQLQSSNLEFHDIIEYNPAHIASPPYKIFVRTESPFLKDKLDIQLTLTIEEVEPGVSCRQILEGHLRVKMFGVGRIVEGIVKDSLINTYKKLPEIVRRWQLFREEALARGDGRQLLLGRPPVGCEVTWIRQEVLQVLKEPLPEEAEAPGTGSASPVSALCPVAGASEASEASPARAQQRRAAAAAQRAAGAAEAEAVFASAAAQQQQQAHRQEQPQTSAGTIPEEQLEDLRAARRTSVTVSEYYDAREVCCDDEVSSAGRPPRPQQPQPSQQQEAQPAAAAADGVEPAVLPPQPAPSPPGSLAALAAAALARGAHHRRGLSTESATSTDTPTTEGGQPRAPGSRRFWRRFNRDYGEWDVYWDKAGVEHEVEPGDGQGGEEPGSGGIVGRALHAVEEVMRNSYYSTSILLALFMLRRGWLRVEPDAKAPTHDEQHRRHEGHRHRRTGSSGATSTASEHWGGAHEAVPSTQPRPQSLARVAQEVYGRMVSGPRKAGSALWQASVPGAKAASGSGRGSDLWPASNGFIAAEHAGSGHGAPPPAAAKAPGQPSRHRKTMSLDTGTAAAARDAAAAALLERQEQRQQQGQAGGSGKAAAGSPPLPHGWSPGKQLLGRRPSDMANVAAMASMQRTEHRVRAPSRLSCFGGCRRLPAVKD
ncbi:hypothetical protein ABPG75_009888 [Micractinium tetrahymenae]